MPALLPLALRAVWPQVIADAKTTDGPGARLWLDTPRVQPVRVIGDLLLIDVPTPVYTTQVGARFGATIAGHAGRLLGRRITRVRCRLPRRLRAEARRRGFRLEWQVAA